MIQPISDAAAPGSLALREFSWYSILFGYPVLGIWYWCTDQTIVQKILAAKTEKDGRDGAIFAGFLKILPVFLMVLPGVIGYVLFQEKIGDDNDATLMVMMKELLPVGVRGLMAAGLLAALMSTIEAALNSTATLTAEDIVKRLATRHGRRHSGLDRSDHGRRRRRSGHAVVNAGRKVRQHLRSDQQDSHGIRAGNHNRVSVGRLLATREQAGRHGGPRLQRRGWPRLPGD